MLQKYRKKIDKLDKKLVAILSKRIRIVEQIAEIKQKEGLPILQKEREEEHLHDILTKCNENKSCKSYIHNIFEKIFEESRKMQK